MVEKTAQEDRFNWRLPLYAVAAAMIVALLLAISSPDLELTLYLLVAVPIGSVVLVILVVHEEGRQWLSIGWTLVVYWAVSAILVATKTPDRETLRWSLWSKRYKAEVLRQPRPANGELKHVEWDGWGFAGAGNTVVYLVFDPTDSLAAETKSHPAGRFSGIPCEVPRVRRLENGWYSVMFYTETEWGRCSQEG